MSTHQSTKSNRSTSSGGSGQGVQKPLSSNPTGGSAVPPSNPPPLGSFTASPTSKQPTASNNSPGSPGPGSPGSPLGGRRRSRNTGSAPPGMDLVVGEELDEMLSSEKKKAELDQFTTTTCNGATGAQQRGRPEQRRSVPEDDQSVPGLSPHGLAPHGLPNYNAPAPVQQATASPGANFPANPQRLPSPPTPSKRAKVSGAARKLQASKEAADAQAHLLNQQSNNEASNFVVSTGPVTPDFLSSDDAEGSFCLSEGGTNVSQLPPKIRHTKCFKPPAPSPKHIPLLKLLSGVDAAAQYSQTSEGRKRSVSSPQPGASQAGQSLQVGFIAPGVFKWEQKVAVALVERAKHREWLEALENESTMNRNMHRVGLHMMASEAYHWNKMRRDRGLPFVPMPKQFMRGLRHDFNLLLGPTQEKDRYHAALQATIALRMWHPPAPPFTRPNIKLLNKTSNPSLAPNAGGRKSSTGDASSTNSSRSSSSNGETKRPKSKGR